MSGLASNARSLGRQLVLGLLFIGWSGSAHGAQAPVRPTRAGLAEEIGSLRNARVAITRGTPPTPLVYFATAMDSAQLQQVKQLAPNIRVVVGLSPAEAVRRAEEAHAADATYAKSDFLKAAKNLVWVQAHSAGVERYLAIPELRASDRIVLTNLRGAHGPAIADHA